ncbi:MAG TPA: DUF2461 domain-containing protein [Candidatus Omnitrophota bacterium]|nr:DUF2461 domain-containing protein [Candidatus Omnitrophota bacterium]
MITPAARAFLAELGANNEKAWFEPRKDEYRRLLLEPLRDLVAALAPVMQAIDPGFDCDPKGGAISRIRRDTRFSRDKSPYRVNQWIAFKVKGDGWQDRPAFFMEFGPEGWRYGLGFYAASPATMKAVRGRILARPSTFADAHRQATEAGFVLEGEPYKRPKLPEDAPVAEWWALKTAYYVANRRPDDVLEHALAAHLADKFTALAPMYDSWPDQSFEARAFGATYSRSVSTEPISLRRLASSAKV